MRYALLSDVHANLPALEAVLRDADQHEPDAILHLGDLVGYAPWPDDVVRLLASRGIAGVAGNYDSTVALGAPHCGCRADSAEQEKWNQESYNWTTSRVSEATKAYLRALPFRLDIRPAGGHAPGPRLILVHGTPTLNTLYWTEDRPDRFCLEMAAKAGARPGDVIAFGHTHRPWHRTIEGIGFINAGSVGKPKDGDSRAGYVLLTFDGNDNAVEFIRVDYDVQSVAAAIIEAGLPEAFAHLLQTGGQSTQPI
jgi:predicted phosphodiesterase